MNTRNNVPTSMRLAAEIAASKVGQHHPFSVDLARSKHGRDMAYEGKGWNASLSHKTYVAIKEKCGLN